MLGPWGSRLAGAAAAALAAAAGWAAPLPRLGGVTVQAWAVAVAEPDGRILTRGEGAAELDSEGRPIRPFGPRTPLRVASISKVVVALAVLRLADQGRLGLDDDVSLWLGWPLRHPYHPDRPIRVRHLLAHTAALSDAGGYVVPLGTDLRSYLSSASFSAHPPGEVFDYANLGSVVLATVIERVTGERFDRAAQRLVLKPLGIRACFNWSGCPAGFARRGAVLHRPSSHGGWTAEADAERPPAGCPVRLGPGTSCQDLERYVPGTNGGLFSPQGGLRISVAELARLGRAVLVNQGRFLKTTTHAALFRAQPILAHGAGPETDRRLFRAWSEGGLHCLSGTGAADGDQPLSPRPTAGCGHLGDAYGVKAALVMDPKTGTVRAQAVLGSPEPPPQGRVSAFAGLEEALFALAPTAPPAER